MNQFKGTKGKLKKIYDSNVCIGIGVPVGKNYFEFTANSVLPDCEGWSDKKVSACLEVIEYDMTLYSHAPEMIEALSKVNDFIKENSDKNYMVKLLERELPGLNELIESATNLK